MATTDMELQNGGTKCTIIESFYGTACVVRPGFVQRFDRLEDAVAWVKDAGWEINISIIKGSKTLREVQR